MATLGVTPSGAIGVDELETLARGAAVYGSGGGGSIEDAAPLIDEIRGSMAGRPVGVVGLRELPAEARVVMPAAFSRSSAGVSVAAAALAVRALADRSGGVFDAIVLADMSVFGTLVALGVAAACAVPVVDASGSVRAITRLECTTWAAAGVAPGPLALADGSEVVLVDTDSIDGADRALQAMLAGDALRGPTAAATFAMSGAALRRSAIPDAISSVRGTGRAAGPGTPGAPRPISALVEAIPGAIEVGRGPVGRVTVDLGSRREHVEVRVNTTRGPVSVVSFDDHLQLRSPRGVLVGAPDLIAVVRHDGTALTARELAAPETTGAEVSVVVAPTPDVEPARVPVEAYDDLHALVGVEGPVPFRAELFGS